jgi:hypothetical protein
VVGVRSGRRDDLKAVAIYQKGVIACIGLYLLIVIGPITAISAGVDLSTRGNLGVVASILIALGAMAVVFTGAVFTFLLAIKVYQTAVGILMGLLTLVPCVGLLALLLINGKATNVLQANGYRVGLFGASLSEFSR